MSKYLKYLAVFVLALGFVFATANLVDARWKSAAVKCDEKGKYWDYCDPCDDIGDYDTDFCDADPCDEWGPTDECPLP